MSQKIGKVYLVGGGCGDPELLTLKGRRVLSQCDTVVYDALVNPALLEYVPADCERIYVGKRAAHHALPQEETNELLVKLGLEGKTVVRLKGGGPDVFGRGGEEGVRLHEAGVPFEEVPGITSVIGGLAYAGIPITHRDCASSFQVVTGHLKNDAAHLDWPVLAATKGTLVFLMGMKNIGIITAKLIENGMDPDTPAAVVREATTPRQQTVTGTLANIAETAKAAGLGAPALIVIGKVVGLREELRFFDSRPLFGKCFVVTRSRAQASKLVAKIQDQGGEAVMYPTIRIQPVASEMARLERAIDHLGDYTHLILTSVNGVDLFFQKLGDMGKDSRALSGLTITAIGKATAAALKAHGIVPDVVPARFIGEALVEALGPTLTAADRILLPRSKNARAYVAEKLSEICPVDEIKIYETLREDRTDVDVAAMLKAHQVDYITFTSSTTAKYFAEKIGEDCAAVVRDSGAKCASIGPKTSEQLKALGLPVDIQADTYTIDGLMAAIEEDCTKNH